MKSKLSTLGFAVLLSALIMSGCGTTAVQPTESPTTVPADAPTTAPDPTGFAVEALDAARASVEAQVARLSRLVADLRKLAELERRPLERTPVDVGQLLAEAVELAQETPDRAITLTLPQAPWPLPPVPGDHDLLFLACYNLLDNACKFIRPGDAIEVRAFEDGRWIVVEVADTGPGIPEGNLPHVFEELYRGENARGVEGSGLGLALVRAVARHHGGSVAVRSREGEGTAFTLRLPRCPELVEGLA